MAKQAVPGGVIPLFVGCGLRVFMGKLLFRYGTMGAAKSAHLLMTGFNFEEKGRKVIYVKPKIDNRGEFPGFINSRINGLRRKCELVDLTTNLLYFLEVKFNYEDNTVILVDECQFLTRSQIDNLASIADTYDSLVICYGLRADSNTNLFEGSKRLFEIANTFEELKSTCKCGHKTLLNARLGSDGKFIKSNLQIVIGGSDKYESVCRSCYYQNLDKEIKVQSHRDPVGATGALGYSGKEEYFIVASENHALKFDNTSYKAREAALLVIEENRKVQGLTVVSGYEFTQAWNKRFFKNL